MTKDKLKAISVDLHAAIADVAKKHGVEFVPAGGTYDPTSSEGRLSIRIRTAGIDPEAARYTEAAASVGLKAEDLGRTFTQGRKTYTIVGLSRSYKVCLKDTDGKPYQSTVLAIRKVLGYTNAPATL